MNDPTSLSGERMVAVVERKGADGVAELYLTIENTIEDRVHAYTRLLRMKHVLRKSRGV